ncbi:hypothetical protein KY290_011750 [Solanum tuberosum]|uniref:Uncharacterized protein n=1 Tax=Solanum tuberosum TaxID=4113 RepID=A0ABQ7VJ08_SOLTU|nr:hypothetical protein KY289_028902 [Solanum tuberosum]KAH0663763.1 hypothetical protein KY284_028694 [Solanum tuberosum]KAH0672269.1 hypothetical protein KY284_023356 [Solanum tuberosum]KAH0687830.1 hypothetical protein KY284_018383 [Solanum tuberosum]KAH0697672.1 hypothetical protein KY289_015154 [Solanum tuberosum]
MILNTLSKLGKSVRKGGTKKALLRVAGCINLFLSQERGQYALRSLGYSTDRNRGLFPQLKENLKQDRKQNKIEERKATRLKPRSGVKPFSEGAGLADGNGISGNAVKGEGAKEANSNEESFRGVTPSRS